MPANTPEATNTTSLPEEDHYGLYAPYTAYLAGIIALPLPVTPGLEPPPADIEQYNVWYAGTYYETADTVEYTVHQSYYCGSMTSGDGQLIGDHISVWKLDGVSWQ